MGVAFFLGGLRYRDQKYNPPAARIYSSMMMLAAASLAVPSAFSRYFAPEGTIRQEELLNLAIAGVLLLTYGLYLSFSLKTHRGAFASVEGEEDESHDDGTPDTRSFVVPTSTVLRVPVVDVRNSSTSANKLAVRAGDHRRN